MNYQFLNQDQTVVGRIDDDGLMRVTGDASKWVEYRAWLDKGNTTVPAPEPLRQRPDYHIFWEGLIASSLYTSIREQAMVSLPMNTLATEFIALLGDAKAGRPNETAIQQSMAAILSAGSFTQEQLTELSSVLEAAGLDSIYTLSA